MDQPAYPLEVSVTAARDLAKNQPHLVQILDVREPGEIAICSVPGAECIPMQQIPAHVPTLARDRHWLVLCHHGQRSSSVTGFLRAQGFTAVSSIAGGIDAWAEQLDPAMRRY